MSRLNDVSYEKSKIETIKAGCPICKSDVKGDDTYLFFCKHCNILYKREELRLTKEHVESIMKQKVTEKYTKDKGKLDKGKLSEKPALLQEKILSEKSKKILESKPVYYFASKKSNVVHASNCPYAKNIKQNNRIRFPSLTDAKTYRKCRCIVPIN